MDEDDLEAIDLDAEPGPDSGPALPPDHTVIGGSRSTRATRAGHRATVLGVAVIVVAVAVGFGVHAQHGSRPKAVERTPFVPLAVTGPTFLAPPGLAGLAAGRFVAVVYGTPILVRNRTPEHLLSDIPGPALIGASQQGAVLLAYRDAARVIVGPDFDSGVREPLPPIDLVPDADGRWWSNFGQVAGHTALREVVVPRGTIPVAHVRDRYLLVDNAHTKLLLWRPGTPMTTIGIGPARVLAVSGEKVAWSDATGSVVHVVDLATGRTVDVRVGNVVVSARFSPDRSHLAMLTLTDHQVVAVADTASGKVTTSLPTAHPGGGLDIGADLPPALQPVPFNWAADGTLLLVVSTTPLHPYVTNLDPRDGSISEPRPAPAGLEQVIPLES